MKKFYLFLALALTVVCAGILQAIIVKPADAPVGPEDTQIVDGFTFVMACDLNDGGNASTSFDTKPKFYYDAQKTDTLGWKRVETANVDTACVWVLETGATEADGTWWYVKNACTGRYLSYNYDATADVTNPESLPSEEDVDLGSWWNEEGMANCNFVVTLVDSKDKAHMFHLGAIDNAKNPFLQERPVTNETVLNMIGALALADNHMMMVARLEMENGAKIYAAMNSAYNGHLSRYNDWAAYNAFTPCDYQYFPYLEVEQVWASLCDAEGNPMFIEPGTEPGSIKPGELVDAYNAALTEAMESMIKVSEGELDINDHPYWQGVLDHLNAAKASREQMEFNPVVAGYYRLQCAHDYGTGTYRYMSVGSNGKGLVALPAVDTLETIDTLVNIWQVEAEGEKLYLKSVKYQQYIQAKTGLSSQYILQSEPEFVQFTCLTLEGCDKQFNINVGGKGYFLHQASGNTIVGWYGGASGNNASRWFIQPVSDEEMAKFGKQIDDAKIEAQLRGLLEEAEAKLTEAKNSAQETVEIDETKLISDVAQLSSNATEPTEGSLDGLIDNNYNTFWHSDWHGAVEDPHYLQVELPAAYKDLYMFYVNRNNDGGGTPIDFRIDYCDDPDGEYYEGVTVTGGQHSSQSIEHHFIVKLPAAAQYLRIFSPVNYGNKIFWHAAEIQFYEILSSTFTPDLFEKAGQAGLDFEAAVTAAREALDGHTVTEEIINNLRAAYEAFLAVYTDPAALRAALSESKTLIKDALVGDGPGMRPQAEYDKLVAAYEAAKAWIDNNDNLKNCTKAEIDAVTKALTDAIAAWKAVPAATFDTNHWYYLQAMNGTSSGNFCGSHAMKDGRLACGTSEEDATFGAMTNNALHIIPVDIYTAEGPVTIEGEERAYMYDATYSQWRFLKNGEAYSLQNRATGLFVPITLGASTDLKASMMPGAYTVNMLENGAFEFAQPDGETEAGEPKFQYLNRKAANSGLCTWTMGGADDAGSSFRIITAEEIATDHVQYINVGVDSVAARGVVLPYSISNDNDDLLLLTEVVCMDTDNEAFGMNSESEIAAGTPFVVASEAVGSIAAYPVLMTSETFTYDNIATGKGLAATFEVGTKMGVADGEFGTSPDDMNYLGSLSGAASLLKAEKDAVPGSAWLTLRGMDTSKVLGDIDDAECDFILILVPNGKDILDGVQTIKVNKGSKVIFNLNGQRVSAPTKGLYIINNKKVVVK